MLSAASGTAFGMGKAFILLTMGFIALFVIMVMVGEMRNRNKPPEEPLRVPVLRQEHKTRKERRAEKAEKKNR